MNPYELNGWDLQFDETTLPHFLLVRAKGVLNEGFYLKLFGDLSAFMANKGGLQGSSIPLVFDARESYPSRAGLNTLHRLVRQENCRASKVVLWISQRGPNSTFQHSVALMLRALMWNIQVVSHLDEAYASLGIPMPPPESAPANLGTRFLRWTSL